MTSRETGQLLVKLEHRLTKEGLNASQAKELVDEIEDIVDEFMESSADAESSDDQTEANDGCEDDDEEPD